MRFWFKKRGSEAEPGNAEAEPVQSEEQPVRAEGRRALLLAGLRLFGIMVGSLFAGVAVFNYLIMPQLTGHGSDVQVPDLIGRTVKNAAAILREEGLRLGPQTEQFSSVYPDGYIVAQNPEPLGNVKPGNEVSVAISFGREGLIIPDLREVPYREAQVSLSRSGLRLGRISHANSSLTGKDRILATSPESGALAAPGSVVDLLVSRGPRAVAFLVPDLKGRHISEVRAFFERSGIRLVEVPSEGDYAASPGEVVGQRPAAGGRIRPQDVLEVDVAAAGRGGWR